MLRAWKAALARGGDNAFPGKGRPPWEIALARRLPGEGLVTHSDRGSQYASEHYQGLLAGHGIVCSKPSGELLG